MWCCRRVYVTYCISPTYTRVPQWHDTSATIDHAKYMSLFTKHLDKRFLSICNGSRGTLSYAYASRIETHDCSTSHYPQSPSTNQYQHSSHSSDTIQGTNIGCILMCHYMDLTMELHFAINIASQKLHCTSLEHYRREYIDCKRIITYCSAHV